MLPAAETPAHTEGYEGFYHLSHMEGDEENALLEYIVRDHDCGRFEQRKQFMLRAAAYVNAKYGENTVAVELNDS